MGINRTPLNPKLEAQVLAETSDFLQQVVPERAAEMLQEVSMKAHERVLRRAESRTESLQNSVNVSDQELVRKLTPYNLKSQLSEALKIAERIKDPEKRASTIDHLNNL